MIDETIRGFDFHSHVDLFPDPVAAIASYEAARIVTLAVTTTPKAWNRNREWTHGKRYVRAAIGLHPELAADRRGEVDLLLELMAATPFIGEIGLDGSPQHRGTMQVQREVFTRALQAAESLGARVVSVHSRRASREVLECLMQHTTPARVLPILHWFSDSATVARRAAAQGCYFSINPRMMTGGPGVALVKSLPRDRLLTETDAPFATRDGRPSSALDAVDVARTLALVCGLSMSEMADVLCSNAARVFDFAGLELPA